MTRAVPEPHRADRPAGGRVGPVILPHRPPVLADATTRADHLTRTAPTDPQEAAWSP